MCSIHTIAMPRRLQLEDRADQFLRLGVGQPAADLVEQQQRRPGRQRAGELEALAVEQPERLGGPVGDRDHAAQLERSDGAVIGLVAAEVGAVCGGDEHVLERRHAAERFWHLMRAHQSEPAALCRRTRRHVGAVEFDLARIRLKRAGEHAEQRRLAGAVGADDADRLVLAHRQADVVEHHKRSEALVDRACGEDRAVWQCVHEAVPGLSSSKSGACLPNRRSASAKVWSDQEL